MLVDDDSFALDLLEAVLEPLSRDIVRFEDPMAALQAIETMQPVLVISDYYMPGIDGVTLVERIRAIPAVSDVPVLMLAAFEVGVTDFATRPIDPTELLARARALSRLGAAQQEARRETARLGTQVQQANATLAEQEEAQQRLSLQLRASQHFEAIAVLASGIAHDINNLLTVISGGAETIAALRPDDAAVAEEAGSILRAVDRGAALTRQILAYSRRQALQPKVFDVVRCIERNRLMLAHASGGTGTLTFDLTGLAAPVFADETQFLTALINLIVNARDACGREPRIGLRVTALAHAPAELHADANAPAVLIEVSDNGRGMSSDIAARAFDPFFTTKPRGQGTGLGLSMVHGFVYQSGGAVRLHTGPAAGTQVELYFPLASGQAEPATPPPCPARPAADSEVLRVLVVDDDDAVRRIMARMLRLQGFTVEDAPGAEDAIARLDAARFDIVLSDVIMPGGMDGFDLARWARQRQLPVVLVSGYVGGALPQDLLADHGVRMLRKPVNSTELSDCLRDLAHSESALAV